MTQFAEITPAPVAPRGILYCAYGSKALAQALVSAQSFRDCNGTTAGCAIFTDLLQEAQASGLFDHISGFEPAAEFDLHFVKRKRLPSLKLFPLLQSPFERTLHLDADTYVMGALDEVFDLLGHFDLLLTNEAKTRMERVPETGRSVHTSLERLTIPLRYNAGVFGYQFSPGGVAFLRRWISQFLERTEADSESGNWAGTNDQTVLNDVARPKILANMEINWSVLPNVVYNATGRMVPELSRIGALERVRVFHTPLCAPLIQDGKEIDLLKSHPALAKFAQASPGPAS